MAGVVSLNGGAHQVSVLESGRALDSAGVHPIDRAR
jgi:hypothetical protein